jgi:hypothetical protein
LEAVCDFRSDLVVSHGVSDPLAEHTDLAVNTRMILLSTSITPGHNTMKLAIAHHRATRVTLARVLSSLQVSSTEHGACDHAGVGVVTVTFRQDWNFHTLKLVGISSRAHGVSPAGD